MTFTLPLAMAATDERIAIYSESNSVLLVTTANFVNQTELLITDELGNSPFMHSMIFGLDRDSLFMLSLENNIYHWDVETRQLIDINTNSLDSGPIVQDVSFSPYGGRLAILTWSNTVTSSSYTIVVPDPTLDRLNAIAALCVADAARPALAAPLTRQAVVESTLPDFVAQVEALPEDAIPPACRADLLAVAEAIMAQR